MVSEPQSSDPMDPLAAYSTLSLFPRTFRASVGVLEPDIDSLHGYLNSMALSSPLRLEEQAKTIVNNDSGLLNSKFPIHVEDKNEAVAANDKENPLQRRPTLCQKRARFSFKPYSGQPHVSLLPTLDTSKLQDPVEYFLAHEKLENAKKEIEKQTGTGLIDLDVHKTSRIARQRRPGIPGYQRELAVYRHHYPLESNEENLLPSQERCGPEILIASNSKFKQEATDKELSSQEKESADSVTNAEHRVSELLEDLLSANLEDLEGDGGLTLLQEHLQIKPIEVDRIRLPDFHEFQRSGFTVLGGNLLKRRNPLAGIQNMLTGVNNKKPAKRKHLGEISVHRLASPRTPKSPLASISSLKKRIFQSNTLSDPSVELNIDPSPAINSSPIDGNRDKSDCVDARQSLSDSGKLKPRTVEEGGISAAKMGTDGVLSEDSTFPFDKSVDENESYKSIASFNNLNSNPSPVRNSSPVEGNQDQSDHIDATERLGDSGKPRPLVVEEDDISVSKMDSHQALSDDSTLPSEKPVDQNLSKLDIDVLSNKSLDFPEDGIGGGNVKDMVIDSRLINHETDSAARTNEHVILGEQGPLFGLGNLAESVQQELVGTAQTDFSIKDPTLEELNNSFCPCGQSSPAAAEPNPVDDGPSKGPDIIPEQHIKEPSVKASNEKKKAKVPPRKASKRKELSGRQSLAGAGTLWQSGVRRSTRIRMRPLEYWKGERFLYGRVHDSLATVIGLKYVSPGKGDGKPAVKVKSYVSDEYRELVELAALH